jgi:hypothetical protein
MQRGVLAVFGVVWALWYASAWSAPADAGRFDGRWGVILVCPQAPDGALPWTIQFTADVKSAMLRGEYGIAGRPGYLKLDGPIRPDGTADMEAHGVTGDPAYNINGTATSVPYEHDVTARFVAARGAGNWRAHQTNGLVRVCDFTFRRM